MSTPARRGSASASAASSASAFVASAFVALADTLRADFDVTDLMRRLAGHCVELLDIAAAGVMIADRDGTLEPAAASDDVVRSLERYEIDIYAGPCLTAYHDDDVTEVYDLDRPEPRWARFAVRARTHGYLAVHAVPLHRREQIIGVLNLYSTTRGPLSPADRHNGQALADITTIAALHHRALSASVTTTGQLRAAFTTRLVIEQAKGILTERHGITGDEAFDLLRRHARRERLKLAEFAHDITTGARTLAVRRRPHHPRRP